MTIATALDAINTPPLVTGAGLATLSLVPVLEEAIIKGAIPFLGVQILNILFYVLNSYSTSQPGRIDGIEQEQMSAAATSKSVQAFATGKRGRTLLMPQGWAFSIWGPIFAGELAFCTSAALVKETMNIAPVIKYVSGGFIGSQIFQSLWCASFRPKFTGKGMFVSSAMLGGVAYCLNRAHEAFVFTKHDLTTYCIHFLPLTMHFAWVTAAALVNLNGNIATISDDPKIIAWTGHLSAIGATALGVLVTLSRTAPVYGGVIAWALLACSAGMDQRLKETAKEKSTKPGVYGARAQKWLCAIGAVACSCASIIAAAKVF
jgi:hypothetical protein